MNPYSFKKWINSKGEGKVFPSLKKPTIKCRRNDGIKNITCLIKRRAIIVSGKNTMDEKFYENQDIYTIRIYLPTRHLIITKTQKK